MVTALVDTPEIEPLDFGGWVKKRMEQAGVTAAQLSTETGILYPNVLRLLNSGKNGKPIRPDHETIERIATTLVRLDVIQDRRDAFVAAGYVPKGYKVVREQSQSQRQSNMVHEHPIYNYLDGQTPPHMDTALRILEAALPNNNAENAIQQQTTSSPPTQAADSPSPVTQREIMVTQREMRMRATRLTSEVRARDLRVALAEAVIWTLDMEGRFLLSEGEGLKQADISPGEAVGLRIWDVYKGETDFLEKVRMVLASDGPLEWTTTVRGTAWRCMTEPLRNANGVKVGIVGTSLAVPTISEGQKQA